MNNLPTMYIIGLYASTFIWEGFIVASITSYMFERKYGHSKDIAASANNVLKSIFLLPLILLIWPIAATFFLTGFMKKLIEDARG